MKQDTAERIAAALERQVAQFDEGERRRIAAEQAHVERAVSYRQADLQRLERNRADDLARLQREHDELTAANAEALTVIADMRDQVNALQARVALPTDHPKAVAAVEEPLR